MYAIRSHFDANIWVQASPAAAANRATLHNSGGVITASNLAKLPDSTISSLGVRRLDRPHPSPSQTYMNATPADIVENGDRATQEWLYVDMAMEEAKKHCAAKIAAKAAKARRQGVVVQGHRYDTDQEAGDRYSLIGSAMGAGVAYPAGGIPLHCTQVSDKTSKRLRLDAAQFSAVVQAVAELLVQIADDEDTLLTLAETAADIDAIRAVDIDAVWPDIDAVRSIGSDPELR